MVRSLWLTPATTPAHSFLPSEIGVSRRPCQRVLERDADGVASLLLLARYAQLSHARASPTAVNSCQASIIVVVDAQGIRRSRCPRERSGWLGSDVRSSPADHPAQWDEGAAGGTVRGRDR